MNHEAGFPTRDNSSALADDIADGITRRDFLQGAALTIGSMAAPALASASPVGPDLTDAEYFLERGIGQHDCRYYPPALMGMRGSHSGSFEVGHQLRDSISWSNTTEATGEHYDLVVVGAGISGLTAAYAYRKAHPGARILVLDNHDDIGGHAKRNEFTSGGSTLIGYGGTQSIHTAYPREAIALFSELGIELRKFTRYFDQPFRERHGLMTGVFFDRETFGRDHLLRGLVELSPPETFADAPMAKAARRDMVRLLSEKIDYLPKLTLEEKLRVLSKMSFETFLLEHARVHPDVIKYYFASPCEMTSLGADATPALAAILQGTWYPTYPQFLWPTWNLVEGMALGAVPSDSWGYVCHFPDGNASVARALARALVPAALPGSTMEDLVTARMSYATLDDAASAVRIRLNSTVVRVVHVGPVTSARELDVTYVLNGRALSVRAANVVMACWNTMIPRICPELPEKQQQALRYPVKVPLVYTNVQIRNWQALKKLGVAEIYCPGSFFYSVTMDFPVSIGDYHCSSGPDQPVILHLVTHIPAARGLPPRIQRRAARGYLYATPFQTFETRIRDQLDRIFGPGGFVSARDIEGITVNRWPHGYADSLDGLDDPEWAEGERPNEIGRRPFGRIAIANSDAGALAETGCAIEQALRAVRELG